MITKAMLQKENDTLRERVSELETQLARQAQTVLALQEKEGGGDITERKQAEEALRRSEHKFATAFRISPDSININRLSDGLFLDINEGFTTITGYTREEVIGRSSIELNIWADPAVRDRLVQGLRASGEVINLEAEFQMKDGTQRTGLMSARLIEVEGEACILSITRDISQRKQVEAALQMSEARLAGIIESAINAIISVDEDQRIVLFNAAAEQMFGCPAAEALGQPLGRFIPECFHQVHREHRRTFERSRASTQAMGRSRNITGRRVSGEEFPLEASISQIEVGGAKLFTVILRDITERKQAEAALHESEERFRLFMDNSPTIAWIQDDRSHYVYLNQTYEKRFGVQLEAWRGKTIFEVWPAEIAQQLWQNNQNVLAAGHLLEFTEELPNPDGSLSTWWSFKFPFQDASGQRYVAGIALDITQQQQVEAERAKLKEQLHQAQKMESIGRLAGGVAHDFNNLLTVILGYCELMQARLQLSGLALEQLEQIRQSAKRAERLTRQLLAFSRKQMLVPEVFDLNGLVTNLKKMLERLVPEDIALITVLQPDLWWIKADPGQIEQVIMNLAVNARDAMPNGGRLTIETANIPNDGGFSETLRVPGVRLTVTDTGGGIDEATLAHIFEPFFTTKEPGKGTGLGLATVYGIIKQSGGEITVASQPGKGAAFSLYLPAHEPVLSDATTPPQPEPLAQPGREIILLVEDEPIVRDFVKAALRDYGYTLLEVDHGYQALALAQQEKSIDLLLTDVVMPDINGRELAERIRVLHPRIKVLFMSGYMDDEVIKYGVQMAEVEFIAKPFSPVALAAKVRAILDRQ